MTFILKDNFCALHSMFDRGKKPFMYENWKELNFIAIFIGRTLTAQRYMYTSNRQMRKYY